jgi:hypothetical protein
VIIEPALLYIPTEYQVTILPFIGTGAFQVTNTALPRSTALTSRGGGNFDVVVADGLLVGLEEALGVALWDVLGAELGFAVAAVPATTENLGDEG